MRWFRFLRKKKKKNEGFCWHVYHTNLITYCENIKGRRGIIKETKSNYEIPRRLRYFKLVEGDLSEDCLKAVKECRWRSYTLSTAHQKEIEALHEKECSRFCPWNGKKMVF